MGVYLILALALWGYMSAAYLVSVQIDRNDLADVVWGTGFVVLAWLAFFIAGRPDHALLVNSLVSIWGLRLSWHIYRRWHGKPEDFRYLQWRMEWKNFRLRSYFQVFMLQGLFLYIIAIPVLWINLSEPSGGSWWFWTGALVWLSGFLFEAIADRQLEVFRSGTENKGKILQTGLWRYSRHPNYFGEAVQWWGIFVIALAFPNGWITVVSPLLISYLLRFVSGVPMLERKYRDHPAFQEYAKRTSPFIPLPPGNHSE